MSRLNADRPSPEGIDPRRLIDAVQRAVSATSHTAGQVLGHASNLLSQSRLCLSVEEGEGGDAAVIEAQQRTFRFTWEELCRSLSLFWSVYVGRGYGGQFLPQRLRPHRFIAGVSRVTEMGGVVGDSACHIAFVYGHRVRNVVRFAVPREDGAALGFHFPLRDSVLPIVQSHLRAFPIWDAHTTQRIRAEIEQESNSAWQQAAVVVPSIYQEPQNPTAGVLPVSAGALKVLEYLATRPAFTPLADVGAAVDLSARTLKGYVEELQTRGFAVRPETGRGGVAITPSGRGYLKASKLITS